MNEIEKLPLVRAEVPVSPIEKSMSHTGGDITETNIAGLKALVVRPAYQRLGKLEGSCVLDLHIEGSEVASQ